MTHNSSNYKEFTPFWWASNGILQTILSVYYPWKMTDLPGESHEVKLEDGDRLLLEISFPNSWQVGQRLFVLIHGLTGSSDSRCIQRMAWHLYKRGMGVVRVNLRNCGKGRGLAQRMSHSGRSHDLHEVFLWLAARYSSPILGVGYSKGANILLKLCGELGEDLNAKLGVKGVVAISPPIQLQRCVNYMKQWPRKWLDTFFVRSLSRDIEEWHEEFPHLGSANLPEKIRNLNELDHCYTAPQNGFRDAADYYEQSSAYKVLNSIRIPTLMISAIDDPCVDPSIFKDVLKNPHLDILITKHGGHIAFLGTEAGSDCPWLESTIERWVEANSL